MAIFVGNLRALRLMACLTVLWSSKPRERFHENYKFTFFEEMQKHGAKVFVIDTKEKVLKFFEDLKN